MQHLSARTRVVASAVLIALSCVLMFAAVLAVWMRALVLDTNSYVRAVGPLIDKPVLRDEVAQQVVDALYAHVDVTRLRQESLPKNAQVLAPTIAQGIHDTAIELAASALATTAARRVWEEANRVAHDQVVHVLEDKGSVVTSARGEVAVDLRPLADQVRRALDQHGVRLFDGVSIPALDQKLVLFRSDDLARAQRATKLLDELGLWLPALTAFAIAGAIAVSDRRRPAIGRVGLALAATMVVLAIAIAVGRSFYLDRVGAAIPRAAAAVPFDGLVHPLRHWVRVLFAGAGLGWFATWVAGSQEVVTREHEVRLAIGRTARVHRRVLVGGAVAAAAVVLVA